MSTVEQTSGQRFVRFDEILYLVQDDFSRGHGLPSIETVDWTVLAAMSQYLFQRYINDQPEAPEEVVQEAEQQAEADLYLSLAYAVNSKKRFLANELVTLTEVIDLLRDKQVVNVGPREIDFTPFFTSTEYVIVERWRAVLKRRPKAYREFMRIDLDRDVADLWLERCEQNQEYLSKLSLTCLSTAAIGILAPSLLYCDATLLERIYDEAEGFLRGEQSRGYSGLRLPILDLRHQDYASNTIMYGKHRISKGHLRLWHELYSLR